MLKICCARVVRGAGCLAFALAMVGAVCAQTNQENFDRGNQDAFNMHPQIAGEMYRDDRISVRVPSDWRVAILREENVDFPLGAILRKGGYVLRLCTMCGQASGVVGGRFSEIARYVQPWFRVDYAASWCGKDEKTHVSKKLDRVDFWFTRDPAHVYSEDANDCRQPMTTDTVWYGSYFTERCSNADRLAAPECGGFLLHREWLTKEPAGIDAMVFALTYDANEQTLDTLPRRDDVELKRTLDEAAAIVRSVHYKAAKTHPAQASQ